MRLDFWCSRFMSRLSRRCRRNLWTKFYYRIVQRGIRRHSIRFAVSFSFVIVLFLCLVFVDRKQMRYESEASQSITALCESTFSSAHQRMLSIYRKCFYHASRCDKCALRYKPGDSTTNCRQVITKRKFYLNTIFSSHFRRLFLMSAVTKQKQVLN